MHKKTKNILFLLICLIVLVGGYCVLETLPEKTEGEVQETATETIAVTSFTAEDIVSYYYSNENHDMEIAVTKEGYVNTADAEFKVNSDKAAAQISAIVNLTALQEIDGNDKAEYGLDTPEICITVRLSDDTERNLQIGDSALFEAADYVLDVENDRIFLIPETLYAAFQTTSEEMEEAEEAEETEEIEETEE